MTHHVPQNAKSGPTSGSKSGSTSGSKSGPTSGPKSGSKSGPIYKQKKASKLTPPGVCMAIFDDPCNCEFCRRAQHATGETTKWPLCNLLKIHGSGGTIGYHRN